MAKSLQEVESELAALVTQMNGVKSELDALTDWKAQRIAKETAFAYIVKLFPSIMTAVIGVAGLALTYNLVGSFLTSEAISKAKNDLDSTREVLLASVPKKHTEQIRAGKAQIAYLGQEQQPRLLSFRVHIPNSHYDYRGLAAFAHDGFGYKSGWLELVKEIKRYDGTDSDGNRAPYGFPEFSIDDKGWLVCTTDAKVWPMTGAFVTYSVSKLSIEETTGSASK